VPPITETHLKIELYKRSRRGLPALGIGLLVTAQAIALFAHVLRREVGAAMLTRYQREQLNLVAFQVTRLRTSLNSVRDQLELLAPSLGRDNMTREEVHRVLREFGERYAEFAYCTFLRDETGVTRVTEGQDWPRGGTTANQPGLFSRLIGRKRPVQSVSLLEMGECYSIAVQAPVARSGAAAGSVGILVRPEALGAWLREGTGPTGGMAMLLDAKGRIVYHPEARYRGKDLGYCPPIQMGSHRMTPADFLNNTTGVIGGPFFDEKRYVFGSWSFALDSEQCSLVSCSPHAELESYLATFSRLIDTLTGLALAATLLSMGYAAYLFLTERRMWLRFSSDMQSEISERHEAERKLREYRDRLEELVKERTRELAQMTSEAQVAREAAEMASNAKSTFLASMSHELRTPLHAIIGYTELLQEESRAGGQQSTTADLEKILMASRHLLRLINDVLDVTRIETGKLRLRPETIGVAELVREVTVTLEPLVQGSGNRLQVQLPDPPGTIHTDPTRVRQCLFNLLSNANRFTQRGTVTLEVTRRGAGAEEWVIFTVSDTGIGMTPDQIENAFDMFTQSSSLRGKRDPGGAGLGLFITRGLCELMGGAISVQSEPGRGSRFIIRLPACSEVRPEVTAGGPDGKQGS